MCSASEWFIICMIFFRLIFLLLQRYSSMKLIVYAAEEVPTASMKHRDELNQNFLLRWMVVSLSLLRVVQNVTLQTQKHISILLSSKGEAFICGTSDIFISSSHALQGCQWFSLQGLLGKAVSIADDIQLLNHEPSDTVIVRGRYHRWFYLI